MLSPRTTRCLALAAAAALLVLTGELGLRAAQVGAPVWHQPDARLGWSLRPYVRGYERGQYAKVNAYGQRDLLHEVDKREGVYRIAVLGDERSEGLGLALRELWWWRLPAELDRCGFAHGEKLEVLNFGVADYDTAQQSILLETAVMRYRPDLVLLQFSPGTDARESAPALASRLDRPFYTLTGRGKLRLDDYFRDRADFERRSQFRCELAREFTDRSRVLQLLARGELPAVRDARAGAPASGGEGDARWTRAWQVSEAVISRMQDYAGRNEARLALVATPDAAAPAASQAWNEQVQALGASRHLPVIALASPARSRSPGFAARAAWDAATHAAAARSVAAGLCAAASARAVSLPLNPSPGDALLAAGIRRYP